MPFQLCDWQIRPQARTFLVITTARHFFFFFFLSCHLFSFFSLLTRRKKGWFYLAGRWRHTTISSCVVPFSPCPQSFPASESFPMSCLFTSGGQSIGPSAPVSVLPVNIQDWFPLWQTGLISLLSKPSHSLQKRALFNIRS